MWIARNENGELYLHIVEPFRDKDTWEVSGYEEECNYFVKGVYMAHTSVYLPDKLFPQFSNIKWEDEPIEIGIIQKIPG